jgi:spore germination protein KC
LGRRASILLALALLGVFLGGCWSRREVNELAIVLGAGVDGVQGGRIRLTVQIARPSAFVSGEQGGTGKEAPASWVISAEGRTVGEAEASLAAKIPREVYWGHCIVLVIGEEMAKRGVRLVTNFFQRSRQPREIMWVMVARGEAKEFLETYSTLAKTSAQAAGFLNLMRVGWAVRLKEFAEMLAYRGIQPTLPWVEVVEAGSTPGPEARPPTLRQVQLSGAAVFKEDRMVGRLDPYETTGLLWLMGKAANEEVVVIPSPGEPERGVSAKVRQSKTRVVPQYDGGSLRFKVEVGLEAHMVEQQSREDLALPDKIKALEEGLAREVGKRMEAALRKSQEEYGADIFGFGRAFHRKYKVEWRRLKNQWDEVFRQAEVEWVIKARVRDIGLQTRRGSVPPR